MKTPVNSPASRQTAGNGRDLSWLLDDMVARAAQIRKAALLSSDGLVLAASVALSQEDAEHLSALAAGIQSLAKGGATHFGGGEVYQTVIEMEHGYLFVTAAGEGSCLAVIAAQDADIGLIAYEMALMVRQVGSHLAVASRASAEPGEPM